jgi:hypothetical protein
VVTVNHAVYVGGRRIGQPHRLAETFEVVDGYTPAMTGLENDIDQIEDGIFGGDRDVSRRIHELPRGSPSSSVPSGPLAGMLRALQCGVEKPEPNNELQRRLRDVQDHAMGNHQTRRRLPHAVAERPDGARDVGGGCGRTTKCDSSRPRA